MPPPEDGISERTREWGNAAAPGHPGDLKNCDLAVTEEKLLGVLYATDEWIGPHWDENVPIATTAN